MCWCELTIPFIIANSNLIKHSTPIGGSNTDVGHTFSSQNVTILI